MRTLLKTALAAVFIFGAITTAPQAAADCAGTTGSMGCGPGWIWHDGWRGYGCYPC